MNATATDFPRHPSELSQEIDPVAAYIAVLSRHPAVRRLILFGSRAIGDNWPRSDVDMAVVHDGDDWLTIDDAAREAWTLIPIDLVDYERTSGDFRRAINEHGKVVYERA